MRKKRPVQLIAISILLMVSIIYLILNFSPTPQLSIGHLQFAILPIVLILVFLFIFSFFSFILNNKRRGLLIATFVLGYLILKLLNLTFPFFIVLLAVLLLLVELLFIKRKWATIQAYNEQVLFNNGYSLRKC